MARNVRRLGAARRKESVHDQNASWAADNRSVRGAAARFARLIAIAWVLVTSGEGWTGSGVGTVQAAEWQVAMAGNSFRTAPEPGDNRLRRRGGLVWNDPAEVHSVFFHVDRPAHLSLSLVGGVAEGSSSVRASVAGTAATITLAGGDITSHPLLEIDIAQAGYVRVDLQGIEKTGDAFAELQALLVRSETDGLTLDYVRNNEGNMYYWGRRGPSVHLGYQVPRELALEYAYSEITVPVGKDPIGSYFMANGFGEGYFGIQVNSAQERRVLFSVWSPFQTDNPRDIPADQRIVTLGRGAGVHVGEFGNEGSGGQSYLVYPWEAGRTYRFLTEVRPDDAGSTSYTSWFGDKATGEWRLIASFRRPQTQTHLRGFHSFLESFAPSHGYLERSAAYGNVWVRDGAGMWHECVTARFSVDATGGGRHRLDYTGGAEGTHFFLRNCGFFSADVRAGAQFTRESTAADQPAIDFAALPRGEGEN